MNELVVMREVARHHRYSFAITIKRTEHGVLVNTNPVLITDFDQGARYIRDNDNSQYRNK